MLLLAPRLWPTLPLPLLPPLLLLLMLHLVLPPLMELYALAPPSSVLLLHRRCQSESAPSPCSPFSDDPEAMRE